VGEKFMARRGGFMPVFLFLLVFSIFSVQNAYAIRDFLLLNSAGNGDFNRSVSLNSLFSEYPGSLGSETDYDYTNGNRFFYTRHFRIITGDNPSPSILNFVDTISEILENVWEKEVEELGFRPPNGSETYFIDVHVANTGAYNPIRGEFVTISQEFAGYASI